jgi:hypothetical protein
MKTSTIKTRGLNYVLVVEGEVIKSSTNCAALISWATAHGYTVF